MAGMTGKEIIRRHVFVAGKVQGVGYRWSARSRAGELGLTGWVRNLPDRRVELCFQGSSEMVLEMEEWCRTGASRFRVADVSVSEETPLEDESSFEIR